MIPGSRKYLIQEREVGLDERRQKMVYLECKSACCNPGAEPASKQGSRRCVEPRLRRSLISSNAGAAASRANNLRS